MCVCVGGGGSLTTDFARDAGVIGLSLQFFSGAGETAVVGSGVVAVTTSFAHARTARDGHVTPALP